MTAIQARPAVCSTSPVMISGRSPIRSASAPALGAIRNGVTPHGSSRSPASSGPWPSVTCWNWAMKNTAPVSDALRKKIAALPAEKARERNRRIGSSGALARSSHATNAAISSAPPASAVTTSGLPQPEGEQRDRDVDPEDPLPGDPLGDGAADHRPDHRRQPGDAAEDTHGPAAALGREGRVQQGQRERHDQGRAGALHGARRDQPADAGRQRARRGSRPEQSQPRAEYPPAPQPIAPGAPGPHHPPA